MTPATLTRPTITTAPAFAPTPATSSNATAEPSSGRRVFSNIRRAPWMLALLAPIGAAPLYVSFDTASYGFGMALACVPILAAAAFLLTGILTCVFFLGDESH